MKLNRFYPGWLVVITLAIACGVGFFLRVYFPYDQVFTGDWIKFTSIDAYYHMRLVDSIVHNFPHVPEVDFYLLYPQPFSIGTIHFYSWLLAAAAWVIGLGAPTERVINTVGVYYPVILAVLTAVPVYFIGKALFDRWVGVIAAGLLMVMPGEYIGRTMLGFTDYHVAETLSTTTAVMFLIYALKTARKRGLSYTHLTGGETAVFLRPVIFSVLAGFFLGIYLITWLGALLFVFIFTLYFITQFIIDHLQGESTDYLAAVGFVLFLVALVIFWSSAPPGYYRIALLVAMLLPLVAGGLSRLLKQRKMPASAYPLVLLGLGAVFVLVFWLAAPAMFRTMLGLFSILVPQGNVTTLEMGPLLSPRGSFTFSLVLGNFLLGFFLACGYLFFVLIYRKMYQRRAGTAEGNLLLVWSIVILMATLAQRRFAYYFAVNVALLSAYLAWLFIWYSGLRTLVARKMASRAEEGPKVRKAHRAVTGITIQHVNAGLAILVTFLMLYIPSIWFKGASLDVVKQARFAPTDAWYEALDWMRDNTPEPFGSPDFYNEQVAPGSKYPESAYGVLTWWDYGYWVTRVAHRVPNANPSQPAAPIIDTAKFLISQDETSAREIIDKMGSAYVVIDNQTTSSKIWAVFEWAKANQTDYYDMYYIPQGNQLRPINLFYPAYFQTTAVRLYNFDGKAVTKVSPAVVTYEESVRNGQKIKIITDGKNFTTYEEAQSYLREHPGNTVLGSGNLFVSPVPLEAVKDYELVYSSESGFPEQQVGFVPGVKVFRYLGHSQP
ncbi:MAG: oligosaccharyl transferase, archaeosortase A system-associated [Chloroflexota bacterium]